MNQPHSRTGAVAIGKLTVVGTAIACVMLSSQAYGAGEFNAPAGFKGRWGMEVTVGSAVRTKDRDPSLIALGNGGIAASNTQDDGNLNYDKGDVISSVSKAVGEVELKRDNYGVFVRGKAFSDFHTPNKGVRHGNSANGYTPGAELDDSVYLKGSKFEDVQLLDAYGYMNLEPWGKQTTIRFGNQVVTWGEALFVLGGVNQYSNFDVAALRKPGAQLKEVFLPIPQLSANVQATDSLSLEGFLQLNHERVVIDGCGSFFSLADVFNCGGVGSGFNGGALRSPTPGPATYVNFSGLNDRQTLTAAGNGARVQDANGNDIGPASAVLGAGTANLNFKMDQQQDRRASDKGQFGIAGRFFAEQLGTEFGLYAVNYHQRIPNISLINTPTRDPNSLYSGQGIGNTFGIPGASYFYDTGAENIRVFGMSAATEAGGFSLFGEISFTKNYPAPLNTPDFLKGALTGAGPLSGLQSQMTGGAPGTVMLVGYRPLDKIQMQMSTIKAFPRKLGAANIALIGEIGAQIWKGIEDPLTGIRFGRNATFGAARHAQFNGGVCDLSVNPSVNKDPRYCEPDGFATKTAAGYRLLTVFQYPDLFWNVNVTPRAFLAHDFSGTSADGVFLEDRINIGIGVRADIKSGKYFTDLNYSTFGKKAFYDFFKDKDFLSLVVGANL